MVTLMLRDSPVVPSFELSVHWVDRSSHLLGVDELRHQDHGRGGLIKAGNIDSYHENAAKKRNCNIQIGGALIIFVVYQKFDLLAKNWSLFSNPASCVFVFFELVGPVNASH